MPWNVRTASSSKDSSSARIAYDPSERIVSPVYFLFSLNVCIFSSHRDFRLQIQHFAADRDEQVAKASKALETIQQARITRANVAKCQETLDEVTGGLTRLRKENERSGWQHFFFPFLPFLRQFF